MRTLIHAVHRLRSRCGPSQAGIGLIEVTVAMIIIVVGVLAVAYAALTGFNDLAFARQRQSATGLANQTMEQIRALPFDTLSHGLSNADLAASAGATDPNVVKSTPGSCSGALYMYKGERLACGDNQNAVPLVPHQQSLTVGPTTYTLRAYVTYPNSDLSSPDLRVTVVVSWTSVERRSLQNFVQAQSLFASPGGCLSTRTHPFAAPCQPFLYGTSVRDQGHIDVTGTIDSVSLDHATLWVPGFGSAIQVEQIASVQGTSETSGAEIQATGGSATILGRQALTSGSDNDPAQTKPAWQSTSSVAQSSQSSSLSGSNNTITVTTSAGDTALTTSTVSASASPAQPCPNVTNLTNLNDLLPCGGSTSQLGGTETTSLTYAANGNNVGSTILASVNAPSCSTTPCPNQSVAYRFLATTSGMCPGATGDGCIHADATRNIGGVIFGDLPSGITKPANWNGYFLRLQNFSDSVSAEAGVGSAAPTGTAPNTGTGQIGYWNGTGYTTCTIYAVSCPPATVPSFTWNRTIDGHVLAITMSATLQAGGRPSPTQTPSSCSGTCTRTQATSVSGSPIVGNVTYLVVYNGNQIANLNIHVDLGTLRATASYQAAPSGA